MNIKVNKTPLSLAVLMALTPLAYAAETAELDEITITAEDQVKQQLGVSVVTAKDLEKRPATNDISEVLRTMPGVNLTGNTSSGQRGNKRQIDLRGMGPENTLILIDGKPVTSRNAERYGVRGERNSRGDSNWVPVEAIESIEVLRGPAAARYGSGAMGGVVNIKTKPTTDKLTGSVTYYVSQPEDSKEGNTNRVGFNLSGPLTNALSFRLYGNWNKTKADAVDINSTVTGDNYTAGREGVRNKDINGRLLWKLNEAHQFTLDAGFSRQGNIYNGDTQNSNGGGNNAPNTMALAENGAETARLYRQNYGLTYDGKWGWADNRTYITYDETKNSRLPEALAGGPEGSYSSKTDYTNSILKNTRFSSETYIPFNWLFEQVMTFGVEAVHSSLNDASSMTQSLSFGAIPGLNSNRDGKSSQSEYAVFLEDNIAVAKRTFLTPAVRFDYNTKSGSNWSGGLNFTHGLNDNWNIKGGIARAYKAPNLYQSNPNYLLASRGNGCPTYTTSGSCYFQGNENLKPETSINKEIGFEYSNPQGYLFSLAYFHNAYRNKIVSTGSYVGLTTSGNYIFQWGNANRAVIEGFEGNVTLPLLQDKLSWINNFTYMRRSINKDTGNPLSIIPKYTLNSTLSYQVTPRLDTQLTYTQYGKQEPNTVAAIRSQRSNLNTDSVGSYAVWGVSAGYNWNDDINIRIGINNLFDKQLYRSNSGASTYNEPGRAYYATVKYTF
ncbi:outer membrane receptor for ferrienterochelin and colicins [Pasteurella testudinis DSM 23072]|uniref:Outer membrane receptor for ferrienterochelin and colicins n=2 Tax=Pasteurella testudinis TaxID=761 RepID=A0A1W1VB45_9PAST|nr:outer membrane receptor for ferrienterochelin and colicins [Pasteurella testudinis DSM 23072]SUB52791.1 transferrin binding protein A [Pasteurella testudinis]